MNPSHVNERSVFGRWLRALNQARPLFCLALVVLSCGLRAAPVGTAFTYQGRLNDGTASANGTFEFRFSLHDHPSVGSMVGNARTNGPVHVVDGLFTTLMDFGTSPFAGEARWLEVAVRTNGSQAAFAVLGPRQPLTATPYAIHALSGTPGPQGPAGPKGDVGPQGPAGTVATNVATLDGANLFTRSQTIRTGTGGLVIQSDNGGQFGSGTLRVQGNTGMGADPDPRYRLYVRGVLSADSLLGNGSGLTQVHAVTADSATTALGVTGPIADSQLSPNVPLLDRINRFNGDQHIQAGSLHVPNGNATVGGDLSVGRKVTATSFQGNGGNLTGILAESLQGTISDGQLSGNIARRAGPNTFRGNLLVTGGSGFFGDHQQGLDASAGAGVRIFRDTVLGAGAIFAYHYASNSALNLILQQPGGNVGIGTAAPATRLDVAGEVTTTAVNITSDRNAKEGFKAVDVRDVLEKVLRLPITEWQYKAHGDARHIGPMAQDFRDAFALGRDERHITSVDADGVALAAIQGLNERLKEQTQALEGRLRERDARIEGLERTVQELRSLMERIGDGRKGVAE